MMLVNAKNLHYRALNEALRKAADDCTVTECCGQRYIAAGMSHKSITISGTPGNALGAYLNGAAITVQPSDGPRDVLLVSSGTRSSPRRAFSPFSPP